MPRNLTAFKRWILASALSLIASTAPAATVAGTAVAVRDGNTFVLSAENRQITVKLNETSGTDINGQPIAPEVRQFSLEPDSNAAGRILLNGDSFVSGPL